MLLRVGGDIDRESVRVFGDDCADRGHGNRVSVSVSSISTTTATATAILVKSFSKMASNAANSSICSSFIAAWVCVDSLWCGVVVCGDAMKEWFDLVDFRVFYW
jgi:hypothetical protein